MPRSGWTFTLVVTLVIVLAGCGMKSEEDIVEDLRAQSNENSYRSHATMSVQSGSEQHQYDIEVWYQPPHYYRVALKNAAQDVTQIILRNDEGVFVLTPQDDKHFRFQSNWPDAHGQPYLYQTLVQSIVEDDNREFEKADDSYIFNVAANYKQNQALKRQQIQLNKDYEPERMAILDADGEPLVEVEFDKFEMGANFDSDAFDMERNMKDWGEETAEALATDGEEETSEKNDVGGLTPSYIPEGTQLESEFKVAGDKGEGVLFRYGGDKPFTLLQQPATQTVPTTATAVGEPVHLSYAVGVLLELGDQKQLNWTYDGVDFQLKGALTEEELVQVAESIENQSTK